MYFFHYEKVTQTEKIRNDPIDKNKWVCYNDYEKVTQTEKIRNGG